MCPWRKCSRDLLVGRATLLFAPFQVVATYSIPSRPAEAVIVRDRSSILAVTEAKHCQKEDKKRQRHGKAWHDTTTAGREEIGSLVIAQFGIMDCYTSGKKCKLLL